jgi:transposase
MNVKPQIQQTFIGTDVSKLTIDVSIITIDGFHHYQQFDNNVKGFRKLESWLKSTNLFSFDTALFCMEHTGIYTREYVNYLLLHDAKV